MSIKVGVCLVTFSLASVAPVAAQTTSDTQNSTAAAGGSNLSSKLSKSGGVITPAPGVDPQMRVPAPTPHPNSTPVIPPSATGGGNAK